MMWPLLSVELGTCAGILALLAGGALTREERQDTLWKLAGAGVLGLAALLWWQHAWLGQRFDAMFVFDGFASYFKGLFLLTALVVVLMVRLVSQRLTAHVTEFYLLVFSALLGMLMLASATDLLLLFIALELLTFSVYVMAAYVKTDARSVEAGLKYLILGSVSSGCLVYGISLLYGASGGTGFDVVRQAVASGQAQTAATAGMGLVLAGIGFKMAAVPFHLWVPDVYEGAPTPVVALLSVGSKIAGAMVALRLLFGVFAPLHALWGPLLAVLAAATMCYGNLAAIPQTNVKRLLGYSSIGHAGYLLMGLSTATAPGAEAVGFYALAYLFSNLAVFYVVGLVEQGTGRIELEAYDGLSKRSPLLAAALFIGLLSLAGVPPLAGFVGKLFVLLATVDSGQLWLVAVGAVNVAISLYYYLMVVRRMYIRPAPDGAGPIAVDTLSKGVLGLLVLGILMVGIFQAPFVRLIASAIRP